MMQYKVFRVGPQGILIDMNFMSDLDSCQKNIEACNYRFVKGEEYVCFPVFVAGYKNCG